MDTIKTDSKYKSDIAAANARTDAKVAAANGAQLGALIQRCDLLLTPVHDPGHKQWALPTAVRNWYEEYKAEAWEVYWSRG